MEGCRLNTSASRCDGRWEGTDLLTSPPLACNESPCPIDNTVRFALFVTAGVTCALGAVLNETTVPELRCEIVAGSANNQLETDEDDDRLAEREILYVPDYVANAGGVINIAEEAAGYDRDRAWKRIEGIGTTVTEILALADESSITPAEAADRYAEARIERARSGS